MEQRTKQKKELLDLKSDWVFKRIFGKKENEDLLKSLITAITNEKIEKIELKNTELLKDSKEQKLGILDLRADLDDNSTVNIEMQMKNEGNTIERDIYYLTKIYSEQLKKREKYKDTKKVIIINLLGYNYTTTENAFHRLTLKSEDMQIKKYEIENEIAIDKLQIYILEIPKYIKIKKKEEITELDLWMMLFSGKMEVIDMALSAKAQAIQKAYEELEYLSQDEEARAEYDNYMDAKLDMSMKMYFAKESGKTEGRKTGIKEGRKFGIIEGGKNEKIKIAKNMLKMNMAIEDIIKATKISKKEIEKIEKEMKK